jgi:hypothetical protein
MRGAVVVPVRFTQDDWQAIKRAAKEYGSSASAEIRLAVDHWLQRYKKPRLHTSALTGAIEILVSWIEARTKKRWVDDALTGAAVRENVEILIFHFIPATTEPTPVPRELQVVWELIAVMEGLAPPEDPNVPRVPVEMMGGEWQALARIIRDIGSGWVRNRAVWLNKGERS